MAVSSFSEGGRQVLLSFFALDVLSFSSPHLNKGELEEEKAIDDPSSARPLSLGNISSFF